MIKEINYLSASYAPGADLWVVPASANSNWFKKLNWYCSSQLSIWNYKEKPIYAEALKSIIAKESLPFKELDQDPSKDILVDTKNIFPNKAVLSIDVSKGLKSWLIQLNQKSKQLGTDQIRIFWGQSQIDEFLNGMNDFKDHLSDLNIEIVTCEPDKL